MVPKKPGPVTGLLLPSPTKSIAVIGLVLLAVIVQVFAPGRPGASIDDVVIVTAEGDDETNSKRLAATMKWT